MSHAELVSASRVLGSIVKVTPKIPKQVRDDRFKFAMTVAVKIVTAAKTWVGTKYHHQGRLKKTDIHLGGVDCFGLIMGVANELGIAGMGGILLSQYDRFDYAMLPDGTRLKEFLDKHLYLVSQDQIKLGDILLFSFFGNPQHVGIVSEIANDDKIEIIHCYSGSGMVVQHYLSHAWIRMISGIYRFRNHSVCTK